MRTAADDSCLRLALCAMAADPQSPLTVQQRQWIIALGTRTTPLTADERLKLREPLTAWMHDRMPRCVEIIAAQFEEPHASHRA